MYENILINPAPIKVKKKKKRANKTRDQRWKDLNFLFLKCPLQGRTKMILFLVFHP